MIRETVGVYTWEIVGCTVFVLELYRDVFPVPGGPKFVSD